VAKINGIQTQPRLRNLHLALRTGFIICAVGWFISLTRHPLPGSASLCWEGFFAVLATATTLAGLARRLPAQNVITAAALVAAMSGILEVTSAKTGIPLGKIVYGDNLGPKIFGLLPWPVPLIWIVVVLNARGTAQRILQPWRQKENYGLWVIGLACALAMGFDLGFEPFAVVIRQYWKWTAGVGGPAWYHVPWVNFLGWAVGYLVILVATTPWLINKTPVATPPDDHPLAMWLFLNIFFAVQDVAHRL
jgi:uncharacterized membrane protein